MSIFEDRKLTLRPEFARAIRQIILDNLKGFPNKDEEPLYLSGCIIDVQRGVSGMLKKYSVRRRVSVVWDWKPQGRFCIAVKVHITGVDPVSLDVPLESAEVAA